MLSDIKGWGWAIGLSVNGIILWAGWSLRKKFRAQEDCSVQHAKDAASMRAMGKTLDAVEQQCAGLENTLRGLPTTEVVHKLCLDVQALRGELSTMKAEHNGLKEIMLRVENNVSLLVRGHMKD